MTNQNFSGGGRYYQSANADAQSIKDDFLIRLHEFEIIMNDIRNNPMKGSVQHYLLLGRRGSGKSTLLRRIQIEIENDEHLKNQYVPINLAEEQANIFRLFDLLNEIIEELEEKGIEVHKPEEDDDCNKYTRHLFAAIHDAIERSGKKVVLLLDNIDRVFENLREDSALVREMLLNFDDIKIIGGSTRMTEHFWKYDEPFYNFFRVLDLKPLSSEEIKTLLLHWSKRPGYGELKDFVENRPGQLETVRLLTDGLPRTLQFFVNILINKEQDSGYEYLKQIMDVVTPLYQERLNTLPAAQRKIVLQMAFLWEAAGTKDVAGATLMSTNVVSAQLKQLTDKGITEKIETNTKNHLYRLAERFFNLWLIFTQGNPREKRRARYLTIFMENFYDGDGLRTLAANHLKMLEEHKLTPSKAALLTKALAQSRYIDSMTRDKMITHTMHLSDITVDMQAHLPQRIADINKEVNVLIEKKNWSKALEKANNIEQEDGVREFLLGNIYHFSGDDKKAMHFTKIAVEKGNVDALLNFASLNEDLNNYDLAEEYYLKAIEKGDANAFYNLGNMYEEQGKYTLAEKYFLKAIDKNIDAWNNMGILYEKQEKFNQAEKYYLEGIKNGDSHAMFNIALLYDKQDKYDLAEKYYLQTIAKDYNPAFFNLALLYSVQEKYDQAEKYFLQAIAKGEEKASYNLGALYLAREKYELAEKYLLLSQKSKDNKSVLFLGILYTQLKKYDLSEKYLSQALEEGIPGAANNIAYLYWKLKKLDLAEKYYLLAIEKGEKDAYCNLADLYAQQEQYDDAEKLYLQAIEYGEKDALFGLATIYHNQKKYKQAEKYYLLAIEQNDTDALFALGKLYTEQKKYKNAEKYYLQAIESGDNDAYYGLAYLYYEQGINKEQALNLVIKSTEDEDTKQLRVVINVWNGNINEAAKELKELVKDKSYEELDVVLEHLLYHYQINLVNSLFTDAEFGNELRERFEPLYYAVGVLAGKDNNIALKIPPEIQETVDAIIKRVKEKQEFYYGNKKQ